jgi:hypothetical protein
VTSNLVRTLHRRRRRRRRVRDHARAVMRAVGRKRGETRRRMKSPRMVMRAWAAGAVCEEPSVVGRVNGEACGESSGPRRSGTKFPALMGKRSHAGVRPRVAPPTRSPASPHVRPRRSPARLAWSLIGQPCAARTAHTGQPRLTQASRERKNEQSSSSSEARQERRERVSVGCTERQKFLSENRASASAPASARMSAA